MKVMVTGATGLLGRALVSALLARGDDVVAVGRSAARMQALWSGRISSLTWANLGAADLASCDAVVHLAGANIGNKRWSSARKKKIIASRVDTTQQLVSACVSLLERAPRLLCASAIGVYGLPDDLGVGTTVSESSPLPHPPSDFLAEVGEAWESSLLPAIEAGLPVAAMRFGVVLAASGGALAKMLPSYKLGFGGRLGTGQQRLSWVSLTDVLRAILFLLDNQSLIGPFNVVANEVVSQQQFAQTLAKQLHRPALAVMPSCVVKLLFGEMGEALLLNGQTVQSERLPAAGFEYAYPDLSSALAHELA